MKLILEKDCYNVDSFYNEILPVAENYARKFIKNEEIIKDIIQEAFVSIFENINNIKNKNISPYLFQTIRNKSYNYIRGQKKNKLIFNICELPENSFLIEYSNEECQEKLKHFILFLNSSEKKIIDLSLKNYQNQEIANTLNISINTVKTLKKRAYNNLRKKMSFCIE